jgi:hypothetical protein
MTRHMRNIRSTNIRDMVSIVDSLLLVFVWVALCELDELFIIWVHSQIVIVTIFVTNAIFDVWPPYIQEHASYIFNLFINIGLFFLLMMSSLLSLLRSKLRHSSFLLILIHHISTVILRWLHLGLFFQTYLPFVQASWLQASSYHFLYL